MTATAGQARVGFEGAFNPATDNFEGDYALVLGGLQQENSIWRTNSFHLEFLDIDTQNQPETVLASTIGITDNTILNQEIRPSLRAPDLEWW
ncbi:MAG: hypothetical protein O3C21_19505 [Verrucomicrobia bacterium]|nr:hypothetical protein [Verrucomicrobiota bacterium]